MMMPYDDDDLDPPGESVGKSVLRAVAIAALSTAATKLVDWGVDELRKRYGTEKPKPDPKP